MSVPGFDAADAALAAPMVPKNVRRFITVS
jgi:hypothetical protein